MHVRKVELLYSTLNMRQLIWVMQVYCLFRLYSYVLVFKCS
jgi:hypothetical protein